MKTQYCTNCLADGLLNEMELDYTEETYTCDECGTIYNRKMKEINES